LKDIIAFYELTEGNQVANSKFEISINATNEGFILYRFLLVNSNN
jgi:hypothetical protein